MTENNLLNSNQSNSETKEKARLLAPKKRCSIWGTFWGSRRWKYYQKFFTRRSK